MDKRRAAVIAAIATAIAVPAEGLRQVAYGDIADPKLLTVCYGSTTNVEAGKTYSLTECRARLDADMLAAVETVERCAPGLGDNQLAAFADAVYNMGPTIACNTKKSTAARLLKAGKVAEACMQLPRWNKAKVMGVSVALPGLTKRRKAEMTLCMRGLT
jgi:GH24 family phage-related lysozyme (muramidase)